LLYNNRAIRKVNLNRQDKERKGFSKMHLGALGVFAVRFDCGQRLRYGISGKAAIAA
jgi:hypothetical protein